MGAAPPGDLHACPSAPRESPSPGHGTTHPFGSRLVVKGPVRLCTHVVAPSPNPPEARVPGPGTSLPPGLTRGPCPQQLGVWSARPWGVSLRP